MPILIANPADTQANPGDAYRLIYSIAGKDPVSSGWPGAIAKAAGECAYLNPNPGFSQVGTLVAVDVAIMTLPVISASSVQAAEIASVTGYQQIPLGFDPGATDYQPSMQDVLDSIREIQLSANDKATLSSVWSLGYTEITADSRIQTLQSVADNPATVSGWTAPPQIDQVSTAPPTGFWADLSNEEQKVVTEVKAVAASPYLYFGLIAAGLVVLAVIARR